MLALTKEKVSEKKKKERTTMERMVEKRYCLGTRFISLDIFFIQQRLIDIYWDAFVSHFHRNTLALWEEQLLKMEKMK